MRYQQRMKFLTGLSLETWLRIGAGLALALLLWSWQSRGNTIDDLRVEIATERAAHAVTRASVAALSAEVAKQNAAIEDQRAAQDQARRDLAVAVAASAGAQETIERLVASSRVKPSGVCEPSAAARSIWP